jgi:hypothetical protein
MKVAPVHSADDNCYRVYILSQGLRQQVGSDFSYNEKNQEKKWIDCLNYAKEIEEQLQYYKDKD